MSLALNVVKLLAREAGFPLREYATPSYKYFVFEGLPVTLTLDKRGRSMLAARLQLRDNLRARLKGINILEDKSLAELQGLRAWILAEMPEPMSQWGVKKIKARNELGYKWVVDDDYQKLSKWPV